MMGAIQLYTPPPPRTLIPTGIPHITIDIPGPVDRSYTVINGPLPRNLATQKDRTATPCSLAKMELFHDTAGRLRLNMRTYLRIHSIEPGLIPWPVGGKMIDVNKHLLHEDHFLFTTCFGGNGYDVNPAGGTRTMDTIDVLCRDHQRVEVVQGTPL
jgi:hypothetical protein